MRECSQCKWCTLINNSAGDSIYICVDINSQAYMEEVGICCSCDLEPLEEEKFIIYRKGEVNG